MSQKSDGKENNVRKPTIENGADPGLALRVYMLACGLDSTKLANKIGMTRATLSRKLNGYSEFKVNEAKAIADALEMTDEDRLHIFLG